MYHDRVSSITAAPPPCTLLVGAGISSNQAVLSSLSCMGHETITAADLDEATAIMQRMRIHCILMETTGEPAEVTRLLSSLTGQDPHVAVVAAAAAIGREGLAAAFRAGAADCWIDTDRPESLMPVLERVLRGRDERIANSETQQWLQREVVQRSMELDRERDRLERLSVATLEALVNALEAKDPYLRGHSARIADLAAAVAAEMRLSDNQVEMIRIAGRLHDIGKIGIRESIMAKQGPLSDEEFAEVRAHADIGSQILAPLDHLHDVIACVRSHHERFDGTGYPDGLAGNRIPIGARIIGAAEVYDALTTARPYQERMEPAEAVSRMQDLVGTVLDPKVHEALVEVVTRRKALVFIDEG